MIPLWLTATAIIALALACAVWAVRAWVREEIAREDARYRALRDLDTGHVRVVPFRSETRDRIAAQIAAGQSRHIAAEWAAQNEEGS